MGFIWQAIVWVVFGFVIGAIARFLLPGKQPMPMWMQAGLGIVGSFVGGSIYTFLFGGGVDGAIFNPGGWTLSILGALLVLFVATMIPKKPAA